jgi:hypothetical protein
MSEEEASPVGLAKEEHEPGEIIPECLQVIAVDADEPGEGGASLLSVGREPVVQEGHELAELHRVVQAEVLRAWPVTAQAPGVRRLTRRVSFAASAVASRVARESW